MQTGDLTVCEIEGLGLPYNRLVFMESGFVTERRRGIPRALRSVQGDASAVT